MEDQDKIQKREALKESKPSESKKPESDTKTFLIYVIVFSSLLVIAYIRFNNFYQLKVDAMKGNNLIPTNKKAGN